MNPLTTLARYHASADGYVRISESAIPLLALRHLSSGLDHDLLADLRRATVDALIAGYTEWQCTGRLLGSANGIACLSVGWDWYVESTSGALLLAQGDVRSNIMAIDDKGVDQGMERTAQALGRGLARLDWPRAVAAAIPLAPHTYLARLH